MVSNFNLHTTVINTATQAYERCYCLKFHYIKTSFTLIGNELHIKLNFAFKIIKALLLA